MREKNETIITTHTKGLTKTHRFITGSENPLFIEPGLPHLPILIKPVDTITILPTKKLEAFLEISFSIRILIGSGQKKVLLFDYRPIKISRCFIEDTERSEFAFHMESQIHADISAYENPLTSVYCPLVIHNRSSQYLTFEKMVFRAANVQVYQYDSGLIATPVHITFKGLDQISQVVYRKNPPVASKPQRMVTLTKQQEEDSIFKKSFFYLKNLYSG